MATLTRPPAIRYCSGRLRMLLFSKSHDFQLREAYSVTGTLHSRRGCLPEIHSGWRLLYAPVGY
jgi:hypothetical protein